MRAAPHAGPSRCSHPRAVPALLAVVLTTLAVFGDACGFRSDPSAASTAAVPLSGTRAPFDDAGYWAVADRLQAKLDPLWDEQKGIYVPAGGGVDSLVNAGILLTHSVAAQRGHEGAARNDRRARLVAKALVTAPAFIDEQPRQPPPGSQLHVPGWSSSMGSIEANQHLVYDAEIVDGLVHAWKARRELGLPDETARLIADRIHRVATSRFWRWPTIRLNQINWYALIYAADATVTGSPELLRRDLRAQLARFVAQAGREPAAASATSARACASTTSRIGRSTRR